jgi:hypothetical protein
LKLGKTAGEAYETEGRVHGCGGSIASLLKNETKIFLPIFNLEKIFYTSKY